MPTGVYLRTKWNGERNRRTWSNQSDFWCFWTRIAIGAGNSGVSRPRNLTQEQRLALSEKMKVIRQTNLGANTSFLGKTHTKEWKSRQRELFIKMVNEGTLHNATWDQSHWSWLERKFEKILQEAKLFDYHHNYKVEIEETNHLYYIDFAFPSLHLGIEVDSKMYHSTVFAKSRDADRQEILEGEG